MTARQPARYDEEDVLPTQEVPVWIVQSSISALADSWGNAVTRSTRDRWTVEAVAWWQRLVAAATVALFALVWHGPPSAPPMSALLPGLASIVMNAGVTLVCVRALRASDLSLTVPIMALSPVMLLVTEPLMTGEMLPPLGMIGGGVITLGLYLLNLPALKERGPLGPFRAVWRERGPRLMLVVVIAWSVTAPFDRMAVRAWDPLWYSASLQAGVGLLITPFWIRAWRPGDAKPWLLMLVGVALGAASACQMAAMAVAPAAFVIAIRRFSAPLAVLWGRIWFKEPHFRERLIGAFVMTVGAFLILASL